MKVTIETKFNVDDIVYGFYNNNVWRFKIESINIKHSVGSYIGTETSYRCTAIPPKGKKWECTFNHDFEEHEIYTIDTLKELLNYIIEENKKENNQ